MWLFIAILAACCFGLRGILYHWASKQGMNRNLMLFGVFLTGCIASLAAAIIFRQDWTIGALTGLMMGTFSFVANACMFQGFAVGKPSLIAILTGLPSVVVVILAYLFWGETLTAGQFVAFVLIIIGILTIRYSNDLRRGNLQGAQWGILAMLFFSFNDMSGKWSTKLGASLFPTLFFMFFIGSLLFGTWWLFEQRKSKGPITNPDISGNARESIVSRWSNSRTVLNGMWIGWTNFFGMILIIKAFAIGTTGLVSAVVALNVVLILLYTRIFVKEKFRPLEIAGIIICMAGILTIRMW